MPTQLTVYTNDCIATGEAQLEADAERVLDVMNRSDLLTLLRADVESLDGAQRLCVREMTLHREELLAVEAGTARGPAGRRIRMVQHHVCLSVGPYTIMGQLHERPGVPPLGSIRMSQPMVALTRATIAHGDDEPRQLRRAETLVINGALVTWVRPADANTARFFGAGAMVSADLG